MSGSVPSLKSAGSNRSSPAPIITQNGIPPPSPSTTPLSDSSLTNTNSKNINNNKVDDDTSEQIVSEKISSSTTTNTTADKMETSCADSTDPTKSGLDALQEADDDAMDTSEKDAVDDEEQKSAATVASLSCSFVADNLSLRKSPTTITTTSSPSVDSVKISESSQNNVSSNCNETSASSSAAATVRLNPDTKSLLEEIAAKDREVSERLNIK